MTWTSDQIYNVVILIEDHLSSMKSTLFANREKLSVIMRSYSSVGQNLPQSILSMDAENKAYLDRYAKHYIYFLPKINEIKNLAGRIPFHQVELVVPGVAVAVIIGVLTLVGVSYVSYTALQADREETERLAMRIQAALDGVPTPVIVPETKSGDPATEMLSIVKYVLLGGAALYVTKFALDEFNKNSMSQDITEDREEAS